MVAHGHEPSTGCFVAVVIAPNEYVATSRRRASRHNLTMPVFESQNSDSDCEGFSGFTRAVRERTPTKARAMDKWRSAGHAVGAAVRFRRMKDWGQAEVQEWLVSSDLTAYSEAFTENEIDGEVLATLTMDELLVDILEVDPDDIDAEMRQEQTELLARIAEASSAAPQSQPAPARPRSSSSTSPLLSARPAARSWYGGAAPPPAKQYGAAAQPAAWYGTVETPVVLEEPVELSNRVPTQLVDKLKNCEAASTPTAAETQVTAATASAAAAADREAGTGLSEIYSAAEFYSKSAEWVRPVFKRWRDGASGLFGAAFSGTSATLTALDGAGESSDTGAVPGTAGRRKLVVRSDGESGCSQMIPLCAVIAPFRRLAGGESSNCRCTCCTDGMVAEGCKVCGSTATCKCECGCCKQLKSPCFWLPEIVILLLGILAVYPSSSGLFGDIDGSAFGTITSAADAICISDEMHEIPSELWLPSLGFGFGGGGARRAEVLSHSGNGKYGDEDYFTVKLTAEDGSNPYPMCEERTNGGPIMPLLNKELTGSAVAIGGLEWTVVAGGFAPAVFEGVADIVAATGVAGAAMVLLPVAAMAVGAVLAVQFVAGMVVVVLTSFGKLLRLVLCGKCGHRRMTTSLGRDMTRGVIICCFLVCMGTAHMVIRGSNSLVPAVHSTMESLTSIKGQVDGSLTGFQPMFQIGDELDAHMRIVSKILSATQATGACNAPDDYESVQLITELEVTIRTAVNDSNAQWEAVTSVVDGFPFKSLDPEYPAGFGEGDTIWASGDGTPHCATGRENCWTMPCLINEFDTYANTAEFVATIPIYIVVVGAMVGALSAVAASRTGICASSVIFMAAVPVWLLVVLATGSPSVLFLAEQCHTLPDRIIESTARQTEGHSLSSAGKSDVSKENLGLEIFLGQFELAHLDTIDLPVLGRALKNVLAHVEESLGVGDLMTPADFKQAFSEVQAGLATQVSKLGGVLDGVQTFEAPAVQSAAASAAAFAEAQLTIDGRNAFADAQALVWDQLGSADQVTKILGEFNEMDADGSGSIEGFELPVTALWVFATFAGTPSTANAHTIGTMLQKQVMVAKLLQETDANGDGKLDREEFAVGAFTKGTLDTAVALVQRRLGAAGTLAVLRNGTLNPMGAGARTVVDDAGNLLDAEDEPLGVFMRRLNGPFADARAAVKSAVRQGAIPFGKALLLEQAVENFDVAGPALNRLGFNLPPRILRLTPSKDMVVRAAGTVNDTVARVEQLIAKGGTYTSSADMLVEQFTAVLFDELGDEPSFTRDEFDMAANTAMDSFAEADDFVKSTLRAATGQASAQAEEQLAAAEKIAVSLASRQLSGFMAANVTNDAMHVLLSGGSVAASRHADDSMAAEAEAEVALAQVSKAGMNGVLGAMGDALTGLGLTAATPAPPVETLSELPDVDFGAAEGLTTELLVKANLTRVVVEAQLRSVISSTLSLNTAGNFSIANVKRLLTLPAELTDLVRYHLKGCNQTVADQEQMVTLDEAVDDVLGMVSFMLSLLVANVQDRLLQLSPGCRGGLTPEHVMALRRLTDTSITEARAGLKEAISCEAGGEPSRRVGSAVCCELAPALHHMVHWSLLMCLATLVTAVLAPLLFMTIEEEGGVGSDQSCWGGGDGCWCIRYYGGAAGEIILVPEAVPEAPVDDEKEGLITEVLDSSPDSVA